MILVYGIYLVVGQAVPDIQFGERIIVGLTRAMPIL